MAGGSKTQERESDRQCMHCGLWFSSQGLVTHQRNCFLQDIDQRVQEPGSGALEADSAVDSGAQSPDSVDWEAQPTGQDRGAHPEVDSRVQSPDGIEAGAEPPTLTREGDSSPEGSAPDIAEPTRTDGGLGLSGPPEPPSPVEAESGAATCPRCGDDLGADRDEFREGRTYRCTDCGEKWTGVP
jgi:hypothetical protein